MQAGTCNLDLLATASGAKPKTQTQRRRVGHLAEELGEEKRFNAENAEGAERRDPRTQRGIAVPRGPILKVGRYPAAAEVEDQEAEGD
jgi:hypothetical protein